MKKKDKTGNKSAKDKIEINPKTTELNGTQSGEVVKTSPESQTEAVLTAQQRMKRGAIMRRIAPKLKMLRRASRNRMASPEKLQIRSENLARRLLKKRLAGQRGYDYANLGVGEKMSIDKQMIGKHPIVVAIAKRILPKVRQAEMIRLTAAHSGKTINVNPLQIAKALIRPTKDLALGKGRNVSENFTIHHTKSKFGYTKVDHYAKKKDHDRYVDLVKSLNPSAKIKTKIDKDHHTTIIKESLERKAQASGISVVILEEVYNRGYAAHSNTKTSLTVEQYAFNRVNSFLSQGAAFHMDSDLAELVVMRKVKLPNGKIIMKKIETKDDKLVDESAKRAVKFRLAATYSDPKHPVENQRTEQVFRRFKVNTTHPDIAKKIMEKHLKDKGYKVHGIDVVEDVQLDEKNKGTAIASILARRHNALADKHANATDSVGTRKFYSHARAAKRYGNIAMGKKAFEENMMESVPPKSAMDRAIEKIQNLNASAANKPPSSWEEKHNANKAVGDELMAQIRAKTAATEREKLKKHMNADRLKRGLKPIIDESSGD